MFYIRAHPAENLNVDAETILSTRMLGNRCPDVIDFVAVAASTCLDHPSAEFGDVGHAGDASTPFQVRPWWD